MAGVRMMLNPHYRSVWQLAARWMGRGAIRSPRQILPRD